MSNHGKPSLPQNDPVLNLRVSIFRNSKGMPGAFQSGGMFFRAAQSHEIRIDGYVTDGGNVRVAESISISPLESELDACFDRLKNQVQHHLTTQKRVNKEERDNKKKAKDLDNLRSSLFDLLMEVDDGEISSDELTKEIRSLL